MEKQPLFLTILLAGLAVILVFWLGLQNIPYLGVLTIEAKLGQSTPLISSLGPEVRTKLAGDYQAVLESPVYFEFRAMPWFNQAQILVVYETVGGHELLGLGRQTGPGFNYELQTATAVLNSDGQTKKAFFVFKLAEFYQKKNIYRVLLDTNLHQSQSGSELRIKEIKVLLAT